MACRRLPGFESPARSTNKGKMKQIGDIRFFNEDCLPYMQSLPDKFYDMAVVDPDYGLGKKISRGGTWAAKYKGMDIDLGGVPDKAYFDELLRIAKVVIIWGGNYFADMLPASRCWLVWYKPNNLPTMSNCEMAWTNLDKNSKAAKIARNTGEKRIHITQKPIPLYEWIFREYAKPGMRILDTHGGSMSSAIAAARMGIKMDIFEINPVYYEEGIRRFNKHITTKEEI